ncbi:MAG: hypothetical protein JNL83_38480 [Myxococcales bacterium]|nr:hypothetical protein [Myxococcales bacterium]
MLKTLSVVGAVSLFCLAGDASAETKSWAALKGKMPANTAIVVSADIGALRGTPSFPKLVDWIKSEDKDTGAMLDMVQSTCGTDLPSMFADVSLALDKSEKGVIVIGFNGTDKTKLLDCANKVLAKVDPKMKLTAAAAGKYTEYTMTGESDKLYAAWLSNDVVAISLDKGGKPALDAMLAGQAPSGDLAAYLGKAGATSPVFAAFSVNDDGFKGGYGTLAIGKTLNLALRLEGMTPKDGEKGRKEVGDSVKKGIERTKKQPDLQKVFKGVKVGGKGTEVSVDASVPEAALPSLLPAFDKVF